MARSVGVVVPIYNVEPYLAECLTSIAGQTWADLDVVMVDDGSTDASAAIAAEFAARDQRFRLIQQENGGLGRARNVGARHVRGEYLAFVDSDDVLPDYAYELLVETLERTGSDFVSGNVMLMNEAGVTRSPMHRRPLGATRLRTHITRDRLLMYDRLVPNKLFRRRFWDEHQFRFPEGVLYEDIPVSIPAHYLAAAVDVIAEPVYYWRQRADDGSLSITQRRSEPRAVVDRFAAIGAVSRFLDEPRRRAYKRDYDEVALRSDLRIFLDLLPESDEPARARFAELAGEFLARVDREVLERLPAILRLKWHLVGRGLLPEAVKVIEYERLRARVQVTRRLWFRYGGYPFWRDRRLKIPRWVFRLREELAIRTRLREVTWRNGKLRVKGYAYVQHVGAPFPWSSLKVAGVREIGTGRTKVLPARSWRCRDATNLSGQPRYNHDWAGFSFTLDPRRLRRDGRYVDGTWLVAVGVYGRGVARRGGLAAAASGSGAHPPYRYVAADVRVVPMFTRGGTLRIRVETVRAKVTGHRLSGGQLEISGVARGDGTISGDSRLVLRRLVGTVAASYPVGAGDAGGGESGAGFVVRIPLADLPAEAPNRFSGAAEPDEGAGWQLDLAGAAEATKATDDTGAPTDTEATAGAGAEPARLVFAEGVAEGRYLVAGREIVVRRTRYGYAELRVRTPRPLITDVAITDSGALVLSGTYAHLDGERRPELVLVSRDQKEQHTFPMTGADGRFRVEIAVSGLRTLGGVLPLPAGKWGLRVRDPFGPDADGFAVMLDHALLDRLPVAAEVAGRRYVLRDHGYDQPILEVHSDLRPGERGPYRQRLVRRRHYRAARRIGSVRPAVLYDSYSGKQYSDSPRAIHEELVRQQADVEHLWTVKDAQIELPDTVRPVRQWGAEWYEAMARSRYIVTNAHLPEWFRRRDGQSVVQTWHGTPLKRIGFDIEDVQFANPRYLEKVTKEVPNWSYLVSPNPFSTPIMRRAFRYKGEIIETGYPRNDMLASPDRDVLAERVRARLGLPPGKRAVLYAPTWRDDSFYGPGKYRLDLRLDLDRAASVLGDDHVLLIRRHPNVVDTIPSTAGGFVRDVSGYPDVAELFLVADVLLTDYSSLMFDYANTGRPMLFFTYDLEHYRDQLRGFYFDFERQAPGPLLSSADEVIEALRSLDQVAADYSGPYARFTEQFCALDDGKAAQRVIEQFLDDG